MKPMRMSDAVRVNEPSLRIAPPQKQWPCLLLAAWLLAVTTSLASAIPYTSNGTGGGPWFTGTTWVPFGGIPGAGDTVTILPGDVVTLGLGAQGNSDTIWVAGMWVMAGATLTGGTPPGFTSGGSVGIFTGALINDGTISGGAGFPSGGMVRFGMVTPLPPGGFLNSATGTIIGGAGATLPSGLGGVGGYVLVDRTGGPIDNLGAITGGAGVWVGGQVVIYARSFTNYATGTVTGGAVTGLVPPPYRNGPAGMVYIVCAPIPGGAQASFTNLGGGAITGGSAVAPLMTPAVTMGGSVWCLALRYPPGFPTAPFVNSGTITGGVGWIPGNVITSGAPKTLAGGTVAGGMPLPPSLIGPGFVSIEPPEGEISDDAQVLGGSINLVAGERLTMGNLTSSPAISADDDLTITLKANGVLDLEGDQGGSIRFSAGNAIQVFADTIVLEPGVQLSDLFSPEPIVMPGQRSTSVLILPSGTLSVSQGQTLDLHAIVVNNGNENEVIDWQITDDGLGWLQNPSGGTVNLEPVDAERVDMTISVPRDAVPGTISTITLQAQTQGTGGQDTQELHIFASEAPFARPIPTDSEWGLILMGLLLLAAGTIVIARRRRPASVR